jgi:hypothetical protein
MKRSVIYLGGIGYCTAVLLGLFMISIRYIPPFKGWWQQYEDSRMQAVTIQQINEPSNTLLKCIAPPQASILPLLQKRYPSFTSSRVLDDYETFKWRAVVIDDQNRSMVFYRIDMTSFPSTDSIKQGFPCGTRIRMNAQKETEEATFANVDFWL